LLIALIEYVYNVAVGSVAGLCGQWKSCGEAQG
jgi:hypothetical protein